MLSDFLDLFRQIRYGNLSYLWLALLVPALIALYIFAFKRKRRALEIFADPELLQHIVLAVSRRKQVLKAALLIACAFFLMLTLIEPKWGYHWEDVKRMGIDIIVAVDTSKSMLADDIKPNRLQAAERRIEDLLRILDGDRIGLIAFAGTAFVQCPLTLDYTVLADLMDKVEAGTVIDGTAIGKAIATGVNRLRRSDAKSKVLILLTDGVNNVDQPDPLTAARAGAELGVKIYTIGVGTQGVAPAPVQTPFGVRIQQVQVEIDEELLKKIAEMTGGMYFRATSTNALRNIYKRIDEMETTEIEVDHFTQYSERFPLILVVGLLLFLTEVGLAQCLLRKLPWKGGV